MSLSLMRVLVQRVTGGSVEVFGDPPAEGGAAPLQKVEVIGHGLVLLVGITHTDTLEQIEWMARKIVEMRVFEDEEGRMGRNILHSEIKGELLVVSQFTLYGNLRKGTRPSFDKAAQPDLAEPLYKKFVELLEGHVGREVATGTFGAHMEVQLTNDGPVTLMLEREAPHSS